jgi:hypothetical protein
LIFAPKITTKNIIPIINFSGIYQISIKMLAEDFNMRITGDTKMFTIPDTKGTEVKFVENISMCSLPKSFQRKVKEVFTFNIYFLQDSVPFVWG